MGLYMEQESEFHHKSPVTQQSLFWERAGVERLADTSLLQFDHVLKQRLTRSRVESMLLKDSQDYTLGFSLDYLLARAEIVW
jgi:hypothetical protein